MNTIGKGLLNQQAELIILQKNDISNTDPDNDEQISIENMETALVENELNAQKKSDSSEISSSQTKDKNCSRKRRFTESPESSSTGIRKVKKGRPRKDESKNTVQTHQNFSFAEDIKLKRTKNSERAQSKNKNELGKNIPPFEQIIFDPHELIDFQTTDTPYDYMKLFIPDEFIDKVVEETRRYAAQRNDPFQSKVNADLIRTSQAIMFMTGYITPSRRRMYWEKKDDTCNIVARKAISRNTFEDVMRFTHFADSEKPKNDPFWKVALLFSTLNETAEKYVEATEFVSIHESMIRYFGPHPLKQFIRGKPTRFGFKI